MARLSHLTPAVRTLRPRLAETTRAAAETVRLEQRDDSTLWRKWYKTKRWRDLRERVLVRDGWRCRQTGVILSGQHPAANSPVVDHVRPHRGDPALFWDVNNLQAVSKAWHDSVKQAIERAAQGRPAWRPDWLRPSAVPLTLVCGAPASGKSSHVAAHKGERDIVIDVDVIAHQMSGEPLHAWNADRWLAPAIFQRNAMLGELATAADVDAAWFILSEPSATHRAWWQNKLKPSAIVVMETPEAECIRRAALDPGRNQKTTADAIVNWWLSYDRRPGEIVITP